MFTLRRLLAEHDLLEARGAMVASEHLSFDIAGHLGCSRRLPVAVRVWGTWCTCVCSCPRFHFSWAWRGVGLLEHVGILGSFFQEVPGFPTWLHHISTLPPAFPVELHQGSESHILARLAP